MNKRMEALFNQRETDYVPAGLGFIIRFLIRWNSIWKDI